MQKSGVSVARRTIAATNKNSPKLEKDLRDMNKDNLFVNITIPAVGRKFFFFCCYEENKQMTFG